MAESPQSSGSGHTDSPSFAMRTTIKLIRTKFSGVRDITTADLNDCLQPGSGKENVVLLDCRGVSEYAVSHLESARNVDWEKDDPQQILDSLPGDRPSTVVCYCSVGYRSAGMADKLMKSLSASGKGSGSNIKVYNLEGSLFKWANEGRPMVDSAGQATRMCHPYNAVWGKLLSKELRSSGETSTD